MLTSVLRLARSRNEITRDQFTRALRESRKVTRDSFIAQYVSRNNARDLRSGRDRARARASVTECVEQIKRAPFFSPYAVKSDFR